MAADTEAPAATDWRRLSPVAAIFYVVRYGRALVTDGLPALAPVLALSATTQGKTRTLMLASLAVFLAGGAIWAVLSYLRFRFCLTDGQILIRRGVLHREQLNVDFDRIQDVSIDEPFYVRPFGMAVLNLDTAGSAKKEIALAGLPLAEARRIRGQMLNKGFVASPGASQVGTSTSQEGTSDGPVTELPTDDEVELLTRSRADVARYGLTANGLLWVAIFAGAVLSQFGDEAWGASGRWVVSKLQLGGLTGALQSALGGGGIVAALVIAAGALAIIALLPLLSVLGALWKYANYRLTVRGDSYRRHSGLVSRQEQTLRRSKVQAAVWRQNLIASLLGRINLQLRMVSAGEATSGQGGIPRQPAFLVPALDLADTHRLTSEFLPGCEPQRPELSAIVRGRFIRRTMLIGWLPPLAGLTVGLSLLGGWLGLLVPLLGVPLALACCQLRWRRYGYAIHGAFGWLRDGFLGTRTTVFPLFKVQRVDLSQSPSQRRARLANLTVHLASHSITMPYIALADAQRFVDLSLYHAESSRQPWF